MACALSKALVALRRYRGVLFRDYGCMSGRWCRSGCR